MAAGESIEEAVKMNLPKIYRRFAVAIIGVLLVGLLPASALATGPDTIEVHIVGPTMAGQALSVTVTVRDAEDIPDPDYSGTIHFTSSDPTANADLTLPALPGDVTISDGSGTADAGTMTFEKVGSQTLTATDSINDLTGTSLPVSVTPAAADHFVVSAPPTAVVGTAAPVTVTATDYYGNIDTNYAGTVHLTSTGPGAILEDNHTFTSGDSLDNGVYTFLTGVTFAHVGTTQVVTATDADHAPVTGASDAVTVGQATPDLAFTSTAPSSAVVGDTYTPTAASTPGDPGEITVALHAPSADCTEAGGIVTFTHFGSCVIEAAQTGNDDWAAGAASQTITVGKGTPTLAFESTAPAGAVVDGPTYTPTFTKTTGDTGPVTVVSTTSSICSVDVNNAVSFTAYGSCIIDATQASDDNWITSNTVSQTIHVLAHGSATHFVVAGPASAAPETVQSYTVTATDSLGHTDAGYTGTVKFTSTDGAATLPANSTLTSGSKTFSVTLVTAGTQTVTATDTVLSSITGTSNGATVTRVLSEYHPQSPPVRLLDSRTGNGMPHGAVAKLRAGSPVTIQIGGRNGVGLGATAVTVNAAIVYPSAAAWLFLGPNPTPSPTTFTIAFNKMDITNYGVTVALSSTGTLSATYMATSGTTDLVLDITGWFAPATTAGGETYFPITPYRALDSRIGNGVSKTKFKANVPRSFPIWNRGDVPTTARAVTGNLTAVNENYHGAVFLGPGGPSGPSATINFVAGQIRGNSITVALSSTGSLTATFEAKSGKLTDLVFDVTGYYTTSQSGSKYVPLTAAPILDTRNGTGGLPIQRFAANVPHTFTAQNQAGVPIGATGITAVVAVVHQNASFALAVGPVASALTATSSLNFISTDNCSNGATVALSNTGTLSAMFMSHGGTTDVLIYVTGYFIKQP